jgi:Flp pilus assembly protein TadG
MKMVKRFKNQRGAALLETAITLPLVLLVCVSIFEFGRAYQTWQVMTNAAREGARVSVLPDSTDAEVTDAVRNYMKGGKLVAWDVAAITVDRTVPFGSNTASRITVSYPFNFTVLNPVIQLVQKGSNTGKGTTNMTASALMRNES